MEMGGKYERFGCKGPEFRKSKGLLALFVHDHQYEQECSNRFDSSRSGFNCPPVGDIVLCHYRCYRFCFRKPSLRLLGAFQAAQSHVQVLFAAMFLLFLSTSLKPHTGYCVCSFMRSVAEYRMSCCKAPSPPKIPMARL